jgi:hypothetical protein
VIPSRANIAPICAPRLHKVKQKRPLRSSSEAAFGRKPSLDREGDDVVAALGVDLGVAARTNDDVLLAADLIRGRGRIDARAMGETG